MKFSKIETIPVPIEVENLGWLKDLSRILSQDWSYHDGEKFRTTRRQPTSYLDSGIGILDLASLPLLAFGLIWLSYSDWGSIFNAELADAVTVGLSTAGSSRQDFDLDDKLIFSLDF
jgi:hypothetical protein